MLSIEETKQLLSNDPQIQKILYIIHGPSFLYHLDPLEHPLPEIPRTRKELIHFVQHFEKELKDYFAEIRPLVDNQEAFKMLEIDIFFSLRKYIAIICIKIHQLDKKRKMVDATIKELKSYNGLRVHIQLNRGLPGTCNLRPDMRHPQWFDEDDIVRLVRLKSLCYKPVSLRMDNIKRFDRYGK